MKLNARECEQRELSNKKEVREFLDSNHSQGYAAYSKAYGLYHNNELVQIMTFGRPRFNKNFQWEIIRDCTKVGYKVNGGTSKLWKEFTDNNSVRSCICYSYPHNEDTLYTNKYVDYCNFVNISKAKPIKKIYFEGEWQGETKRIDKSILERQGVDRLLKGKFGQDRTNEQILLDLGFEKKYEDGYEPQKDAYFPFGIVYRIDDLDDGSFYIGKCEVKEKWEAGYFGSGRPKWGNHLNAHPNIEEQPDNPNAHHYKRTIIGDNFKTPKEMFDYESKEIRKYFEKTDKGYSLKDKKCCNSVWWNQGTRASCPECGGYLHHEKYCSHYKQPEPCSECGALRGHKSICSKYTSPGICAECGKPNSNHLKSCSKYTKKKCPECGSYTVHRKGCSKYVERKKSKVCKECGHIPHLKTCSKYNKPKVCDECGSTYHHKKTCSKYTVPKEVAPCPECGGKSGNHKKFCSHYKAAICPECGEEAGYHKIECSRYIDRTCKECGGKHGTHRKHCSQYKGVKPRPACEECGAKFPTHKKSCSLYREKPPCPECGNTTMHKSWCSHSKPTTCSECGGKYSKHTKECSKYKPKTPCPECGSRSVHKPCCSRSKRNKH